MDAMAQDSEFFTLIPPQENTVTTLLPEGKNVLLLKKSFPIRLFNYEPILLCRCDLQYSPKNIRWYVM